MLETGRNEDVTVDFEREQVSLRGWVEQCRARARAIGKAVLLRLHLPLELEDPWLFLGAPEAAGRPHFAWNDGRTGLCAAGFGEGQVLTCGAGVGRFDAARRHQAELLERVVDVSWPKARPVDSDLPLALAGFSFSASAGSAGLSGGAREREDAPGASSPWQAWPAAMFYVPEVMVFRRRRPSGAGTAASDSEAGPDGCGVVLNLSVAADDDGERVVSRVGEIIVDLRRRLRATTARPQGAAHNVRALCRRQLAETEQAWCDRVAAARQASRAGHFEKVVLARSADFIAPEGSRFDPHAMLWALRAQHPSSICFAMGHPNGSCFLGATPEVLAQVSGKRLATHSLAGTARRGATAEDDEAAGRALIESLKDRREHAVVVDVVSATLRDLCVELSVAALPRLVRLAQVQHLETPLVGELRQAGGLLDLVERLHPTPSVGGWPAEKAHAWLREHEPLERGWYASPIGWITAAGDGVMAVGIRSVLVHGAVARAYAGAGIVAASDPVSEWQETELKLRTVYEALRVRPGLD